VKLQVSFRKGKDGFWSNFFPGPLVNEFLRRYQKIRQNVEIDQVDDASAGIGSNQDDAKNVLQQGFWRQGGAPLIALFLGTGNQTANVAYVILERLFDDPNVKPWDHGPDTLLPNLPTMVTFPKLGQFYKDWAADVHSKGVDIQLNTDVTAVSRSKTGVTLQTRSFDPDRTDHGYEHTGPQATTETYDEFVMCVLADDAKRLLGKPATWKEKFVLGGRPFLQRHYDHTLRPRIP
jgi:hypothetical protein